jgi:hypothetical protein
MAATTVTVNLANYAITAKAWPVPEGVRYDVTVDCLNGVNSSDPRRPDNLRVFLDGELATDLYEIVFGGRPHSGYHTLAGGFSTLFDSPTRWHVYGHVRLSLLKDQTRGPRTLNLTLTDASAQNALIAYVDVPVDLGSAYASRAILRSMFNLDPGEVLTTPGLLAQLQAAGVNCLTRGVFTSPGDSPGLTSQALWEPASVDNKLRGGADYCADNGLYLYAAGDDFARSGAERAWINTGTFSDASPTSDGPARAIRRTAYVAQTYGGVVARVDVIDEAPGDPTGDPAYAKLVTNWRLFGGPPLGWPMVETTSVYPTGWEDPLWADYATRYPRTFLDRRIGRADGPTVSQYADAAILAQRDARSSGRPLPVGWELVWKCDCSGPFYTKGGAGGNYNPATDTLQAPGRRPALIVAQVWAGLAYGATHFRMYAFDWNTWVAQRAAASVGATDLQTGSRPGDARWAGVTAAYGSVALYESRLLAGAAKFAREGNWLVAANPQLRWAINLSERAVARAAGGVLITPDTGPAGSTYTGTPVPAGGVVVTNL